MSVVASFPDCILNIVRDYCCGTRLFWQHWFHGVLIGIRELKRKDDTYATYYNRTGISDSSLYEQGDWKHTMLTDVWWRELENPLGDEIQKYFPEYDYEPETSTVYKIVYQYLDWFYYFPLAQSTADIRRTLTDSMDWKKTMACWSTDTE